MFYTALVVDNVDMNKSGIIEVYVPTIMTKQKRGSADVENKQVKNKFKILNENAAPVETITTYQMNTIPAYPISFTESNHGQFLVPEIGDEVFIFFKDNNFQVAYYMYANNYKKGKILDYGKIIEDEDQVGIPMTKVEHKVLLLTKSGHVLAFNDSELKNGVIIKAANKHKIKMDTNSDVNAITIESESGNKIVIDDSNEGILMKTKDNHRFLLDDKEKGINITTANGFRLTLDDKNSTVSIVTPNGVGLEFDDKKTKLTIDAKDIESSSLNNTKISSKNSMNLESTSKMDISTTQMNMEAKAKMDISTAMLNINVKGAATIEAKGTVDVKGAMVTVDAQAINLGKGAISSLVKGTEFLAYFNTHTHFCPPVVGGPSSPPMVPMLPTMLSMVTRTK